MLWGRNWLDKLKLNWVYIFSISVIEEMPIQEVVNQHPAVFQEGYGMIQRFSSRN